MSSNNYSGTRKQAILYRKAGLSVLPISADGTKAPFTLLLPDKVWAPLSQKRASRSQMHSMFPGDLPIGIGIMGGVVSGVEMIDVDDAKTWWKYKHSVEQQLPGLLDKIPQVETPRDGGGRHLYLFSPEPGASCKLARDEDGETLIEVKGRGGYVLAPGSHPSCHTTGREYRHVAGPPITDRPQVSTEEKAVLLAAAISLNRYVEPERNGTTPTEPTGDENSPGNCYVRRETFETAGLLEKHGWSQLGTYGDRMAWARPGKDTPGFSALSGTDQQGNDRLVVFTSNSEVDGSWSPVNAPHVFPVVRTRSAEMEVELTASKPVLVGSLGECKGRGIFGWLSDSQSPGTHLAIVASAERLNSR